jgi:uncharacterized protein YprB with RNaseH-like and TPR domain
MQMTTLKTCLLDYSLCMLKGVSPAMECSLHRRGFLLQRQVAATADTLFSPQKATQVKRSFEIIQKAHSLQLTDCLVNSLPCGHRVRALHDFFHDTAFLDIETDGMSLTAPITCISVLQNGSMTSFVQGQNLENFLEIWKKCSVIVTFNGKKFDVPRIARTFHLSTIPAHIDLMDEAAHFGLRGGLKKIASSLGFQWRNNCCLNGKDAISLFREYASSRNPELLSTLISYNQDDVNALVFLYKHLLQRSLENTIFYTSGILRIP